MEESIRELSEEDGIPFYFAAPGIPEDGWRRLDDADSYVVAERGSRSHLQGILAGGGTAIFQDGDRHSNPGGRPEMAPWRRRIRRHGVCSGKSGRRYLRLPCCNAGSKDGATSDSFCHRGPPGRRLVWHRVTHGEKAVKHFTLRRTRRGGRSTEDPRELQPGRMIRSCIMAMLGGTIAWCALAADDAPPPQAFRVRQQSLPPGPRITPFLQYQAEQAWSEDDDRLRAWEGIHNERELLKTQGELRQKLLQMIGGLPEVKTDLRPQVTGRIQMDGFTIEKLIFQSLPGVYVTALVYVPDDHSKKHPAVLLLMYPRPVLVAAAVLDFFPIEGTRKTVREVRRLYERFGHGDRIALVEGYHSHQFSLENQEAALDFLDHFNQMPIRHGLPPVKELASKDLQCTRTGQVMLDYTDARSLMSVIRENSDPHKTGRGHSLAKEYYGDKYSGVKQWHVSEYAGVPPRKEQISWEAMGSSKSDCVTIDRYMLRHSKLLEMPLLHIHKSAADKRTFLLWFREGGKATADDWPEIKKYVDEGYDIVSFDFRGLGETRMPYTAVSPDDPALGALDFDHAYVNSISGVLANHVYNALLIGRPYFLQMIEDSEIASRFAREKLGAKVVAITAPSDAYTLASAIAETLPGIELFPRPDAKVLKWSEIVEQKREIWPIQYLLPSGAYIH